MIRTAMLVLVVVGITQMRALAQASSDWAAQAFAGAAPSAVTPMSAFIPSISVVRQDYGTFQRNRSVIGTPLRIGQRDFARGLGTHANSEIVVTLPAVAKSFHAFAGIDNNYDTAGVHGSAVFTVELDGQPVYQSSTLHGGNEPAEVNVPMPDRPPDSRPLAEPVKPR